MHINFPNRPMYSNALPVSKSETDKRGSQLVATHDYGSESLIHGLGSDLIGLVEAHNAEAKDD